MNPHKALISQIELYRDMTGEARLQIALDLHDMACEIAREGIRAQHPEADVATVEDMLKHRIELARAS